MQVTLDDKVINYINPKLRTCDGNTSVADAAKEMTAEKLDSILVLEGDGVAGIVTSTDILEKVVAEGKDPNSTRLKDIKNYPIMEVSKDSSVVDAISIMNEHDIRRLLVRDGEKPLGMITRKQIVGNMGRQYVALPELELPNQIKCPYCESTFPDSHVLSKHIDDIHIGKGLLQGNLKQG